MEVDSIEATPAAGVRVVITYASQLLLFVVNLLFLVVLVTFLVNVVVGRLLKLKPEEVQNDISISTAETINLLSLTDERLHTEQGNQIPGFCLKYRIWAGQQ